MNKVDKVFWLSNIPENMHDLFVEEYRTNGFIIKSDSAIIMMLEGVTQKGIASEISALCKGFYHRGYVRAQRDIRRALGAKE